MGALLIATKYERREGFNQTVKLQPFTNQQKIIVCGRPAYGFTRMAQITMPTLNAPPIRWADFDTFVIVLVGRDEESAASLIAFTSRFCIQPNH